MALREKGGLWRHRPKADGVALSEKDTKEPTKPSGSRTGMPEKNKDNSSQDSGSVLIARAQFGIFSYRPEASWLLRLCVGLLLHAPWGVLHALGCAGYAAHWYWRLALCATSCGFAVCTLGSLAPGSRHRRRMWHSVEICIV